MRLTFTKDEMTQSATRVWHKLLHALITTGQDISPRGKRTKELLGYHSVVEMNRCVVSNPLRKLSYRFLCAEAHWIGSGDNRVETIAPYNKHIEKFSDDGVFFNGAYGPMFVEQLPYILKNLKEDSMSRQAVATTWRQRPGASKDIPCTVSLQWLLRPEGSSLVLSCIATMRSSDAWLGWPYDVFNFSMLSALVALHLRKQGVPAVALGDLHLIAGSQHLYEENWVKAEECYAHPHAVAYDRFYLSDYRQASDLLHHLKLHADRDVHADQRSWLREFLPGHYTGETKSADILPFAKPLMGKDGALSGTKKQVS